MKVPRKSILDTIPIDEVSALKGSQMLQSRVSEFGFDWRDPSRVLEKIREETDELDEALRENFGRDALIHELGDILLATVNMCRHLNLDANEVASAANDRFSRRFRHVEACLEEAGTKLNEVSLETMEQHWCDARQCEATEPGTDDAERRMPDE